MLNIGEKISLRGWTDAIRDHGGVLFLDLRAPDGTVTQCVFYDDAPLRGIVKETCVLIEGTVRARAPETVNPNIATGEVEVLAESVEILGEVTKSLPFEIRESRKTREDLRLIYRYLDLRNPEVRDNIVLRSNIIKYLRRQMEDMGFLEIQTPILTSSSPEGARDYLVPSRKHHGAFYALPQAPQQFKQLLMVSGFEKYFQIAPCFRDEDARADRSPGEFYQLDFEMAFAGQEDVFKVAETVLYNTFRNFTDKHVTPPPFERIPYSQALKSFGSDKPDLRNPLRITDLTAFFSGVDFKPFKGRPTRGIKVGNCAAQPRSFFEYIGQYALDIGMKGLGYISSAEDGELKGPIVKFLDGQKLAEFKQMFNIKPLDTVFFISDTPQTVNRFANQILTELARKLELLADGYRFCFVTDYPMYGISEETGKLEFTHNPFSMPQGGYKALVETDPLEIKAYQYDVVCNGIELSSGAVRNHRPEVMKKAFEIAGYTEDDLRKKFGALYTAFRFGAPPHAGMAPGVDRIVMLLAGTENIREVIAFPMNSAAQDLLMGAPGEVTEHQLREIHIKIR